MEDISLEIKKAIQSLVIQQAEDANERVKPFIKNTIALSKQFPDGAKAYLSNIVFNIKVEMKKDFVLGSSWIDGGCQDIFNEVVMLQIFERLEKWFSREKQQDRRFVERGWLPNIKPDHELMDDLASYPVKPFFDDITKINMLESLLKDSVVATDNFQLIKTNLTKYGFFDLEKVRSLEYPDKLVELIAINDMPYQIAMFDYLQFLEHVKSKYTDNGQIGKRNSIIAEIVNKSIEGVKNNINYLNKPHPKGRYTSSNFVAQVMFDYKGL